MTLAIRTDEATGLKVFNTRAAKATDKIAGKGYSAIEDEALKTLPAPPPGETIAVGRDPGSSIAVGENCGRRSAGRSACVTYGGARLAANEQRSKLGHRCDADQEVGDGAEKVVPNVEWS